MGLISLGEERKAVGLTISGKYIKALDTSGQPGLISQREETCWREKRPSRPLPQIRRVKKKLDIRHFHYLSVSSPICLPLRESAEHSAPHNHVGTEPC